jgi:transposase
MVMTSDLRAVIKSSKSFDNNAKGIEDFIKYIKLKSSSDFSKITLIVEATGVYYESLAYATFEAGFDIKVILPNRTNSYAKSFSNNSKTDKLDAKLLATYGLERGNTEKKWNPGSPKTLEMKRLCRERNTLIELRTATQNRIHALSHSHSPLEDTKKRQQDLVNLYDKQIKEIEQSIKKLIASDDSIKQKVAIMTSIPGVGEITAAIILSETDGFTLFTSIKQLIRYAGYDVVHSESGSSIHKKTRISKKGNSHIRGALHFPAMTAVTYNPIFKDFKDRIFARTSIKMKGYTAVQRKLLCLMYCLVKSNKMYDPAIHLKRVEGKSGHESNKKVETIKNENTFTKNENNKKAEIILQ